jgi:quercetin dioxygenase-like cupin family protein
MNPSKFSIVLSGTLGHEVNGELYMLKPGMVGILRPGDKMRHIVPKGEDAKVLVIWAQAGEAKRNLDNTASLWRRAAAASSSSGVNTDN